MYEVEITHIFLIFTKAVPDEQVDLLKKVLAPKSDIRLTLKWIDDAAGMELSGGMDVVMQDKDNHPADFCITDIPKLCRLAATEQIPSLLFLHEGNKNAPMQQIPYAVMDFEGIDYAYLCDIYKRFFHIPWTILETERCVLREMTPEDLDALYEVYADPEISRYTEALYEDREQELAYMKDYIEHVYRFCGLGIWVIVEKQINRLIGRAGLADESEGLALINVEIRVFYGDEFFFASDVKGDVHMADREDDLSIGGIIRHGRHLPYRSSS